jgi:hypothetical protein
MKIFCKELNKYFEDKETLFKEFKENESIITAQKKLECKSIDKGLQVITNQSEISKAIENETIKGIKLDNDYYYFVVNSSNILDSHGDVHVDGNWNKTVKEQQGKVYLVWEHQLNRNNIIAVPKDIELIATKIPFALLEIDYEGDSYCLIYKVAKNKIIDKQAKEFLEQGIELQASVRMLYVKIEFAFNSNSPEFAKEKQNFDLYFPLIANKNEHKEIVYFTIVKEAKNVKESSLVLFGSNNVTGIIENNNKEQLEDTQIEIKTEQVETTQKTKRVLIF